MGTQNYHPSQDYCSDASRFQSVPSEESLTQKFPNLSSEQIQDKRIQTPYSCADEYYMASIQDNRIYIATTAEQHNQLANNQPVTAHGGVSGYFSDEATLKSCMDSNGVIDNAKYNELCQISPYLNRETGDITYKPHIDCFEIDRDRLQENYGTRDFNAAIAKCEANNQFGCGGGNQGYNPHIGEMIQNKSLKHQENDSFSDPAWSTGNNNPNLLTNSQVSEKDYKVMMADVKARGTDCVANNTPHPSEEVQKSTGFPHNKNPIQSETGHGVPVNSESKYSNDSTENGGGAHAPPVQDSVRLTEAQAAEARGKEIDLSGLTSADTAVNSKAAEMGSDISKNVTRGIQ